jgi:Flp pilus assembly pilin Flp
MVITNSSRLQKFPFLVRRVLERTTASIGAGAKILWHFWKQDKGQDLIEYTLLLAFVALASSALCLGAGRSVKGVWTNTGSQLSAANSNLGSS